MVYARAATCKLHWPHHTTTSSGVRLTLMLLDRHQLSYRGLQNANVSTGPTVSLACGHGGKEALPIQKTTHCPRKEGYRKTLSETEDKRADCGS